MKKILIVNKSFAMGGIQSSMVNMANELSKYYKVDLFIYNPAGKLKERLNDSVCVIDSSWRFKALGMSFKEALKSKSLRIMFFRIFATVWSKLINNKLPINLAIKNQKKLMGYDLAIAYHHEQLKHSPLSGFSRMVDKCVDAKKKVAWLHYDVSRVDLDSKFNNEFYQKMDKVVCVSKSLMYSFVAKFPFFKDKTEFCYNFMPYNSIKDKAKEQVSDIKGNKDFICFSACRLAPVKAIERAVLVLAKTFIENPEVKWYIAGDGSERGRIERAIREKGLEQQIILMGAKSNPYPYMKNSHLIINLSYHEAAPMVFLEAKALGIPVFATRTLSAEEMLTNNENAFICENTDEGIQEKFSEIINSKELVEKAKENLKNYFANNDKSFDKVRELLI